MKRKFHFISPKYSLRVSINTEECSTPIWRCKSIIKRWGNVIKSLLADLSGAQLAFKVDYMSQCLCLRSALFCWRNVKGGNAHTVAERPHIFHGETSQVTLVTGWSVHKQQYVLHNCTEQSSGGETKIGQGLWLRSLSYRHLYFKKTH